MSVLISGIPMCRGVCSQHVFVKEFIALVHYGYVQRPHVHVHHNVPVATKVNVLHVSWRRRG